jgi:hypothetical protein
VGGGGAYPPPRVEVEVNESGGGPNPPPGVKIEAMRVEERHTLRVEIEAMWVEERRALLPVSKSR